MPDINVTITIPDAHVAEVSAATGATTKAQFQDWVRTQIKGVVKAHRVATAHEAEQIKVQAAEQARTDAMQAAEASDDVTLS